MVMSARAGGDWLTGFPAPLAVEGCRPNLLVRATLVSQLGQFRDPVSAFEGPVAGRSIYILDGICS